MKHRFRHLPFLVIALLLAVFMNSCREDTLINAKVSPGNNVNVFSDTLWCVTHTYNDDSAITSVNIGGIPIYQSVGSLADPFFGTYTGTTFFQVIPLDFTAHIYDSATIDSATLVLPYSGYTYGDTTNQSLTQSYQVFYMQDGLDYNTNYFAFDTKNYDAGNPLSDPKQVNIYHLKDSFLAAGVNHAGLRIPLKLPVLLSHLMPALNALEGSTNTSATFLNAFKGICVRAADPTQATNAMPYFQLDGTDYYSQASVLVYYHLNTAPGTAIIEPYYFNTGSCAHFNNIKRSYSSAPVNNLLTSTAANDEMIAIQNKPGAGLDIKIYGINSLPQGVINKAELQLTLLPEYNSIFSSNDTLQAPEKLYPLGIGNASYPAGVGPGVAYNVADRYPLTSLSPLSVMDGYLHNFTYGSKTLKTFTIDIPREVMASRAAKNDTLHLHVNGTQDFYGAFHMVAGGGSYPDILYRAKLIVVFSKL